MNLSSRRNQVTALLAVTGLALLSGCGSDSSDGDSADKDSAACAPYSAYQGHEGKTVTIYGSIRDVEQDMLNTAWKEFASCTGIKIQYEGSGEFEAQLQVRVDGGNAPDLAFIPQPGLLATLAKAGKVKAAPADLKALADQNWSKDWLTYGTVNNTSLIAVPLFIACVILLTDYYYGWSRGMLL